MLKSKRRCRVKSQISQVWMALGVIAGVYLFFKFLFPLVAPFLLAYLLVLLLRPLIEKIRKKVPINRGLLSAVFLLLLLLVVGILGFLLLELAMREIKDLLYNWKIYRVWGMNYLHDCCCGIEDFFGIKEGVLMSYVEEELPRWANNVKAKAVPTLMQSSWGYMKQTASVVGGIFIAIIAAILMLNDYDSLHKMMEKLSFFDQCRIIKNRMLKACLVFLKAQFIIMAIIAAMCSVVLLCMGNPYGLLIGLAIGLLDALPMLGTGVVLIPWAVFSFIQGNIWQGVLLLALYGATSLTREFLEPKLMGNQMGLPPIFFLATVYWGLYLFGIMGVFVGPIAALLVVEILKCVFGGENLDKEENMA